MSETQSRVALVTGGSHGIGAAIALALAKDGVNVALTYQHGGARVDAVVGEVEAMGRRALAIQADSGDVGAVIAAVDRTVAELGRLDVLVNNAGVHVHAPLTDIALDDVDRALAVNIRAPFLAAWAAAAHMAEGGRIISIGSNVIERTPFAGMTLYALSKAALVGLTKGLARDLGAHGITANLVSPGPIDTEMNPADGPNADAINALVARGRYGTPAEVAATVAHLAGPGAANVNGANIAVDGGITA